MKPFHKDEFRTRIAAGVRILELQATLSARIEELEATRQENRELKLHIPL